MTSEHWLAAIQAIATCVGVVGVVWAICWLLVKVK